MRGAHDAYGDLVDANRLPLSFPLIACRDTRGVNDGAVLGDQCATGHGLAPLSLDVAGTSLVPCHPGPVSTSPLGLMDDPLDLAAAGYLDRAHFDGLAWRRASPLGDLFATGTDLTLMSVSEAHLGQLGQPPASTTIRPPTCPLDLGSMRERVFTRTAVGANGVAPPTPTPPFSRTQPLHPPPLHPNAANQNPKITRNTSATTSARNTKDTPPPPLPLPSHRTPTRTHNRTIHHNRTHCPSHHSLTTSNQPRNHKLRTPRNISHTNILHIYARINIRPTPSQRTNPTTPIRTSPHIPSPHNTPEPLSQHPYQHNPYQASLHFHQHHHANYHHTQPYQHDPYSGSQHHQATQPQSQHPSFEHPPPQEPEAPIAQQEHAHQGHHAAPPPSLQ